MAAAVLLALEPTLRADNRLLPFQGRLTDAGGSPVPDGARVVQFKIYDAPVGGRAVWNGEVQKLSVNSGLVSTILGTRASLGSDDKFIANVDANGVALAAIQGLHQHLLAKETELRALIDDQRRQIDDLKAEITALKAR